MPAVAAIILLGIATIRNGTSKTCYNVFVIIVFWKLKTLKIKTSKKLREKKSKSVVYFLYTLIVFFFSNIPFFLFSVFNSPPIVSRIVYNVIMHRVNARVNFQRFPFWFHSFCKKTIDDLPPNRSRNCRLKFSNFMCLNRNRNIESGSTRVL